MPLETKDELLTKSPVKSGVNLRKIMYLGKRKIVRLDEYNERRKEIVSTKGGSVWNAFTELEDLINKSALAKQYFGKSQSWFSQRLNGCTVMKKSMAFKEEEYHTLADAFRDIAKRLQAHADEIDAAKYE